MPTKPYQSDELQARIDAGIEQNRMGDAAIRVGDADGAPLADAAVDVVQTDSDFLFGGNIFMLGNYDTDAENAKYEEGFLRLFNAATVPLYWHDLEPEPGRLRFAVDSEPIFRRPPPDLVVDFCEERDLNMNGHCLMWDNPRHSVPPWFYDMPNKKALIEQRVRQIAERYGERMQRWDIVNEPTAHFKNGGDLDYPYPAGYEAWAFECAGRYMPESAFMMINENNGGGWPPESVPYYHKLIRELIDGGARIDGIGFQWHLFSHEAQHAVLAAEKLTPGHMTEVLDSFLDYHVPQHISEITIHAFDNDAEGQRLQAELTRDTYRFWFSRPAVHAITWWNVPDGGAVAGEDNLYSGLLNRDLTPKPAFEVLDELINHDWRTETTVTTDGNGVARFRGFHGAYELRVADEVLPFDLHADGDAMTTIKLKNRE